MNNYTITHCHSDFSNGTTNIDSVTKFNEYIDRAAELGMKAFAFTEHGNCFSWYKKKEHCEKKGLKYIHATELYLTKSLDEKVRDNYHIVLYAKNYDGFIELNKLLSNAYNREDNHFYYVPRISFEELTKTSDNILFTTACIGGILARKDEELKEKMIKFMIENKHRCWLEVQHHQTKVQIDYNKYLLNLSMNTGLNLICGTDTHALNEKHAKGRRILQKSKNIFFEDEEGWDITLKTYDELVELYKNQGIFSDREIENLLNNTNVLADMVEEFELDKSYKYPKLYDDSLATLKQKIIQGIKEKGIDKYPNYSEYKERIKYELSIYEYNNAIDFLLLDENIKSEMRKKGVYCGPSRGSVSGSIIAYLIGMTEVDSIKHNMNFERFMNTERISLADVDTDWPSRQREKVKEYIFNNEKMYCAEIITFNTVALKGSIRDCARALEIPLEVVSIITNDIEDPNKEKKYREQYPELFEYVDIVNGTIVSIGLHPCGSITSPIPLDDSIGTITLSTSPYPVSMINMKEIDKLFFVKLDVLGLDNIELINETCKLAGIERLTIETVPDDEKVWESMCENTLGVFQWESDLATKYLKQLFSKETVEKIKKLNPNFKYIDLFSVGNGALRPAGASYREELANGLFRDNGHEALNKFLSPTLGYLVYQEQIIEFLNVFCGYTMSKADTVRRGFAKKEGTEEFIPEIKEGFIKTMKDKFNVPEEESEHIINSFLIIIEDASDYLFSLNHAKPYSYIGYMCGWLRYYYPLEFLTVMLNICSCNIDKTKKIVEYAKQINISIEPPTYGKSKAEYFCDKENNVIYKGLGSVKFLNDQLADSLYDISQTCNYETFEELYINTNSINSRQWEVLIKIGYFREFGSAKYLLKVIDIINMYLNKKQFKKDNVDCELISKFSKGQTDKMFKEVDTYSLCKYLISNLSKEEFSIGELAKYEAEYIGSISITNPLSDNRECIVLDVNTKYTPTVDLYRIKNGDLIKVKVSKDFFNEKPVAKYSHIYVSHSEKRNKRKLVDGKWTVSNEYDIFINYYIM